MFQTNFLKDLCNTITDRRCRCKRQIHDTKLNPKTSGSLLGNQLTNTFGSVTNKMAS